MYEVLLKWALDTFSELTKDQIADSQKFVHDAIQTKNAIVLERFKIADDACVMIMNLTMRLEDELSEFRAGYTSNDNSRSVSQFVGVLEREFHPKYYREYRKVRGRFDATNDLVSAYALAFIDWLRFNNVKLLLTECGCKNISDVCRVYRMVWTFVASLMPRLLRLTSNDLRFWLTDIPYSQFALEWAREEDIKRLRHFFIEGQEHTQIFFLSLENSNNIKRFWHNKK